MAVPPPPDSARRATRSRAARVAAADVDWDALLRSPIPHTVRRGGDGWALQDYVARYIPAAAERLEQAVAEGRIRNAEGVPLGRTDPVRWGEVLLLVVPPREDDDPLLPTPRRSVPVLHLDDALLAADKPAGLLSYPLGPRRLAAQTALERQLDDVGEASTLRPLHRIDRETSGVLLFARHLDADRALKRAFAERTIDKTYLALVRGRVDAEIRTIDAPLGPADGPIRIQVAPRPGGLSAETGIVVLAHFGSTDFGDAGAGYTWVAARPRTGRQHQIRAHLASIGHPLVGDRIYADGGEAFLAIWDGALSQPQRERLELPRHALHAWTVDLPHPDGGRVQICAPVPDDLRDFAAGHGGAAPDAPGC